MSEDNEDSPNSSQPHNYNPASDDIIKKKSGCCSCGGFTYCDQKINIEFKSDSKTPDYPDETGMKGNSNNLYANIHKKRTVSKEEGSKRIAMLQPKLRNVFYKMAKLSTFNSEILLSNNNDCILLTSALSLDRFYYYYPKVIPQEVISATAHLSDVYGLRFEQLYKLLLKYPPQNELEFDQVTWVVDYFDPTLALQ